VIFEIGITLAVFQEAGMETVEKTNLNKTLMDGQGFPLVFNHEAIGIMCSEHCCRAKINRDKIIFL